MVAVGCGSLAFTTVFLRRVPASRHVVARAFQVRPTLGRLRDHLRDAAQLRLDAMAALLMGTFDEVVLVGAVLLGLVFVVALRRRGMPPLARAEPEAPIAV